MPTAYATPCAVAVGGGISKDMYLYMKTMNNEMLVTDGIRVSSNRNLQRDNGGILAEGAGSQRCHGSHINRGGDSMKSVVRRLTPLECTRLQGFPDGWVDIGEWTDSKGKVHKDADSPKYKALGNSIATPFWFWLLRRISAQYERPATLGSLFDGIGGFPYCWERCNGKGTAVWASEIEEFCVAVTKVHFPEEDE